MKSKSSLRASSKSRSATILTFLEATISKVLSTEATMTFALARRNISMMNIASISSVPLAIGTRICILKDVKITKG